MTNEPERFPWISLLLMASLSLPAASRAGEKGDLWEVTSRMSMQGLPAEMPAQTQKLCSPKDWKEPPAPTNEQQNCQSSDFKVEGSKYTWKLRCSGPPAMTGTGEVTRDGAEAYSGSVRFAGEAGAMTIKLNGKRIGDCDSPGQ
jgi:hypothetical protein